MFLKYVFLSHYFICSTISATIQEPKFTIVGLVTCKSNSDCSHLENATCKNSVCQCGNSRFCTERSYHPVTKIGLGCRYDEECNIQNAFCQPNSGKCQCLDRHVGQEDGKKCLPVSEGLGSDCEENIQCSTKTNSSLCQDKKCVCQTDMHEYNGKCYRSIDLGQHCSTDAECSLINSTICLRSKCTCAEGFIETPRESLCLKIASGINSPCQEDIQCLVKLGGGSECNMGFCKCSEAYQYKESLGKCVREYLLDELCSNHTVCQALDPYHSRLECALGICKCRPEFFEVEGECMSSSAILYIPVTLLVAAILLNYFTVYIFLRNI